MECKKFYRVHTMLNDPEADSHLCYDFKSICEANEFAHLAFKGCDISKVWIELLENEIDTANSPMWRELLENEIDTTNSPMWRRYPFK